MKTIFTRVLAIAGVASAVVFSGAAAAQAAPAAAADCLTVSEVDDWAQGEVTFCPQNDGTTRTTGWVEDLKPGGPWSGQCVEWNARLANGGTTSIAWVCLELDDSTYKEFDYTRTLAAPAVGAYLARTYF